MQPLSDPPVRIPLGEDGSVLSLSHKPQGFIAHTLAVVAGVVGTVEVGHVGRGPIGRGVARIVCHSGSLVKRENVSNIRASDTAMYCAFR